jgi:hypothetical protein
MNTGTGETGKKKVQRPPIFGEMLHGFEFRNVDISGNPILANRMLVEIERDVGWGQLAKLLLQFQRQFLLYSEHGQGDVE